MPRPSNTDQRRSQIAKALLKVMAKKGYEGASITAVAKAARLTPGLVHYHFANKLEILLAVVDELFLQHGQRLDEALTSAGSDPARQVTAFIDAHLGLGAFADPEALACWIALSGEAIRHKRVRESFERRSLAIVVRLTALIDTGRAAGALGNVDSKAAAAGIMAAIQGYYLMAATARSAIPRGSAAATVKAMTSALVHAP